MFIIQYKVSTNLQNPNFKSIIRKPWDENPYHGLKTVCWKTVENNGGGLAGYPPPAFPAQPYHAYKLVKVKVKLHAKNITYTQQYLYHKH